MDAGPPITCSSPRANNIVQNLKVYAGAVRFPTEIFMAVAAVTDAVLDEREASKNQKPAEMSC